MMSLRPAPCVMGVAEPVQIRYQQYSLDERRNTCVKVCPEISMPIDYLGAFCLHKRRIFLKSNIHCRIDESSDCGAVKKRQKERKR